MKEGQVLTRQKRRNLSSKRHFIVTKRDAVEFFSIASTGIDGMSDGRGGQGIADRGDGLDARICPVLTAGEQVQGQLLAR